MDPVSKLRMEIATKWVPKLETSIQHAASVLADPNASQEAYNKVWDELQDLQKREGKDVLDAYCEQVRDEVKKRLLLQGIDPEDVEDMVESKFSQLAVKIPELPEKVHKMEETAPKVWRFAKLKTAATVAGVVALAGVLWVNYQNAAGVGQAINNLQDQNQQWQNETEMERQTQQIQQDIDEATHIEITEEQLDEFENSLAQPAQPAAQAAVEIPAAVAARPVEVTIEPANAQPQTYSTSVGALYSNPNTPPAIRETVRRESSSSSWNKTSYHFNTTFDLGSFDGAPGTSLGSITLSM